MCRPQGSLGCMDSLTRGGGGAKSTEKGQLELERSAWARYSQLNSVESPGLQAQGELFSVPPQCAHGEDEQHNHFGNQVGSFSNS